jgi:hypothetical protein
MRCLGERTRATPVILSEVVGWLGWRPADSRNRYTFLVKAYGTDRMTLAAGGHLILNSRTAKGWRERAERTPTSVEHPGTAVLWDGQFFEVLLVQPAADGSINYELAPWSEHHMMRGIERYDAMSSIAQRKRILDSATREKRRRLANRFGVLTGLLPAIVQDALQSELGIKPVPLTIASTVPGLAFAILWLHFIVRESISHNPPLLPRWTLVIAIYCGVVSLGRLYLATNQWRPIGSPIGLVAYALWYTSTGRPAAWPSPFQEQKGQSIKITSPDEERALRDSIHIRQPLLTLLPAEEQKLLRQRLDFDPSRLARVTAVAILLFALMGVYSMLALIERDATIGRTLSLLTAGYVATEQLLRLNRMRAGWSAEPVGSALSILIRPLVKGLLRAARGTSPSPKTQGGRERLPS